MPKKPTRTVSVRMGTVKRRFDQWRMEEARGRIPEKLWAMAVAAAKEHGITKTAHTLSLEYTALKKRMGARGSRVSSAKNKEALKFVQLPMSATSDGPECVVEVEDAQGSKLRIQLKGGATTDLLALSRALWSHER